jgi:putative addiction module component (TIGR02574 family)
MSIEEIQQGALALPENERAQLAAQLLTSLPVTLTDPDDGVAEALRRDKELDEDPSAGRTWDEIKRELGR